MRAKLACEAIFVITRRKENQVYRLTIKIGKPGRMYEVQDIEAPDLLTALQQAVSNFPEDAAAAELLELRRLTDPERREYTPA